MVIQNTPKIKIIVDVVCVVTVKILWKSVEQIFTLVQNMNVSKNHSVDTILLVYMYP